MRTDEQAIRDLISTWQSATAAGDLPLLLSLMSDDVVFLTPGQPPMLGRDAFAAGFQTALERFRIQSTADIQEIQVSGDLGFSWTHLTVTMTPLTSGLPVQRKGYTLTVLRRESAGNWVLARDANLLGPPG